MTTYVEYNKDTLKHLQEVQLIILKDFIEICKENNLTYFAYGGTAIGAIRHKGFIPWDDDVDVMMFRDDYEKFLDIMKTRENEKYFLITEDTEDYFYTFAKLCLKGTKIKEDWTRKTSFDIGINIDIFPFDYMPNNKIKRKLFIEKYNLLSKIFLVFIVNHNQNYPSMPKKIIAKLTEFAFRILKIDSNKFKKYYKKRITQYKDTNYLYDIVALMYKTAFHKDTLLPPREVAFEDIKINVPNDYNHFLTTIYGDYMKIPPLEDRYNHFHEDIDFGKY